MVTGPLGKQFSGRGLARFKWGKPQNRSSGRPKAGRRADFEAFPNRIRSKLDLKVLSPYLEVLTMIFIFVPWPGGVPGEGTDCHFPKGIIGFGPIPARFLKFLVFILALSLSPY